MVGKAHPFYADSPQLGALHGLLTPCVLTHSQVSHLQGMSDSASPILAIMGHEDHTFVCFCGIMKRLVMNFYPDGYAIATKFAHLKAAAVTR